MRNVREGDQYLPVGPIKGWAVALTDDIGHLEDTDIDPFGHIPSSRFREGMAVPV